ncbi:MAG: hypothetical protein RMJ15_03005 [Nitrososphaerota archaeon]|nr:hypothetical protein [Candidatus Bathyarchaeota archaeon]MDW8022695.1 hypothetical protein [Nitrososphaerota archaeon]
MSTASTAANKISSMMLLIIFLALAVSLSALVLAIPAYSQGNDVVAAYLLVIGLLGLASCTYVLLQTRKRIMRLRIEVPPVTTTIECRKCGFKNVREFQRGDYIFKEVEPCQKCNEKMLITAIYREVREKKKEVFTF